MMIMISMQDYIYSNVGGYMAVAEVLHCVGLG